jgi:hypothetical protein
MTMQENDTSGVSYTRPSVWDEPRGRTRVLLLATVALASLVVNGILLTYFAGGGVR